MLVRLWSCSLDLELLGLMNELGLSSSLVLQVGRGRRISKRRLLVYLRVVLSLWIGGLN